MKVDEQHRTVELTRRNLRSLLAKLDGHPPNSECTIGKSGWLITAVEDERHYTDSRSGEMHADTERALR